MYLASQVGTFKFVNIILCVNVFLSKVFPLTAVAILHNVFKEKTFNLLLAGNDFGNISCSFHSK